MNYAKVKLGSRKRAKVVISMAIAKTSPSFAILLTALLGLMTITVPKSSAETLLSESKALKVIFPNSQSVETQSRSLTAARKDDLQNTTGLRFPEPQYRCFVGHGKDSIDGYAVIMNEIGKEEFITFVVAITPDGKVADVAILEYRESRGAEVAEKRFMKQFHGKNSADPIRINQDITNYAGATLSAHAIALGVKKALLLVQTFYLQNPPDKKP